MCLTRRHHIGWLLLEMIVKRGLENVSVEDLVREITPKGRGMAIVTSTTRLVQHLHLAASRWRGSLMHSIHALTNRPNQSTMILYQSTNPTRCQGGSAVQGACIPERVCTTTSGTKPIACYRTQYKQQQQQQQQQQ
jgi:hypothetical protein